MPLRDLTSRTRAGDRLRIDAPDPASGDVVVTGVSLDSRSVVPGDLYAALPGFHAHGADFAADALAAGAVAVLTDPAGRTRLRALDERAPSASVVPVLLADHPREVLGEVAATVYGHPSEALTVLGVTGTNGKTTTAYLIESALRARGQRTGLIGTVETRIGDERLDSERTTPEATDLHALLGVMRERGIDACVMEVSSHALALHRVDGVVYDVALFTNLSQDHLDFHATMEDYFAAKASLFTPARSRAAVVCVDDAWGARLARESSVPTVTFASAPARGVDWVVDEGEGGAFDLREVAGARVVSLVSHLPGHFNIANTALAALALLTLGLDVTQVEEALAVPPDVPGRMEVVAPGGPEGPRCIVDFAHTPDAVDAALRALRPSTRGRLIAVLGAGGDRDRSKRPAMGAAAARQADIVVVTDDNPRSEEPADIRAAVVAGARETVASGDARATEIIDGGSRSSAIAEAVAIAVLGAGSGDGVDTVVVLGKGHEKGQEIHGVKHPFDDREAVRAALGAALGAATSPGVGS
ncbi:UDP-N-acetylmuramoylalanyl-D-glutamate--2,6-diaminopimelate ligase [Humibacillus xanthopallidus]|uniref:UDP-N-acetylmuramoyl-L-alanyl-D-glutamate--2,6-diaminopimelate ligase n=1 Tax=Humibacillus xanthopallidus TaxID=412689 RepID=A0A543HJD0_9MICO|nr:UDP-N-acetylmuramoylalanyl-D-glutamate--2,6-diaminopimelate ligase [Humibacillus xanthopallidus]